MTAGILGFFSPLFGEGPAADYLVLLHLEYARGETSRHKSCGADATYPLLVTREVGKPIRSVGLAAAILVGAVALSFSLPFVMTPESLRKLWAAIDREKLGDLRNSQWPRSSVIQPFLGIKQGARIRSRSRSAKTVARSCLF